MSTIPEFDKLSDADKERVVDFIHDNIYVVIVERNVYSPVLNIDDQNGGFYLDEDDHIDFLDDRLEGYWCNKCDKDLGRDVNGVVLHVIHDLGLI